jgi:CP family cyanate transporter-like MFS transporter
LTLVTAMDHSADHRVAGRLVAFTQGVGFAVAAIAPTLAGGLRAMSGSFTTTWVMLLTGVAAMILVSFLFSPRSYERWR